MPFDRTLLPDPITYFENQGLTLKGHRSAKWKTTTCNFHGGSDSMRINVATGAWVCMSCSEKGGDVLAYEMALTGADFFRRSRPTYQTQPILTAVIISLTQVKCCPNS